MAQKKNPDLVYIKKHYGENFARLCRSLFPSILEHEGLLSEVITENIHASHSIYDALDGEYEDFSKLIQYKAQEKLASTKQNKESEEDKPIESPFDLIRKACYKLYECKTYADTLKFKKYYARGEELCTFDDEERTDDNYVFFAVKDDAQKIKRAIRPKREDNYGTSVISIQLTKNPPHTISIKNRYNHTVDNPDATFSNNLENIHQGLTRSFGNYCGIDFAFELPKRIQGFVRADDGRIYPYNECINNIYYCPDNIVIHQGRVMQYEKEKFDLIDHFLICKQDRIVRDLSQKDSFIRTTGRIDKIEISKHVDTKNKNKVTKEIRLSTQRGVSSIVVNAQNQMIEYHNPYLTRVPDNFLSNIYNLQVIDLPGVTEIGNNCLQYFSGDTLAFENVETIGYNFATCFNGSSIDLPKAKTIGSKFCVNTCDSLTHINLASIQEIERQFLLNHLCADPVAAIDFTINPEMKDLYKIFKARNSCVRIPIFRQTRLDRLREFQEKFCDRSHRATNFHHSSYDSQA